MGVNQNIFGFSAWSRIERRRSCLIRSICSLGSTVPHGMKKAALNFFVKSASPRLAHRISTQCNTQHFFRLLQQIPRKPQRTTKQVCFPFEGWVIDPISPRRLIGLKSLILIALWQTNYRTENYCLHKIEFLPVFAFHRL